MDYLSIDFETRSTVDLRATGVYRYAEDPTTDVWCFAYAFGADEPELWRAGDLVPAEIADWIRQGLPLRAWNAQFERTIWRILVDRYGFPTTTREQWYCTAAEARAMALPGALGDAAIVLGVEQQKDAAGSRLMLQMAKPRAILPDGRITWWDTPQKMQRLFDYCLQDVRTERAVFEKIRPLEERERAVFLLDQTINDRGVLVDKALAEAAQDVAAAATDVANGRIRQLTGNPMASVTNIRTLIEWMRQRGVETESLDKQAVSLIKQQVLPADVAEVLRLREECGKSSVAKIAAMLGAACEDGRIRGTLLFHGAATGRWSGRLVQPQNFPRGNVKDAEQYIPQVLARDIHALDMHHAPLEVISSLLRALFVAAPSHALVAADFAAIEARVLAWLADEEELLETFRTGGDVYKAMGSKIYGKPAADIKKDERQLAKMAVLGLGYGMGAKKFRDACAAGGIELPEEEAKRIVDIYRGSNRSITALWRSLEDAARAAVTEPGLKVSTAGGKIRFVVRGGYLWMRLPSGRKLAYSKPQLVDRTTPWGAEVKAVQVWGQNSVTRKWESYDLYSGLLAENAVQAIAADILFEAMMRVEAAGMPVVLSVHDEIVCEVPEAEADAARLEAVMSEVPVWAEGLPLAAEGWQAPRYRK